MKMQKNVPKEKLKKSEEKEKKEKQGKGINKGKPKKKKDLMTVQIGFSPHHKAKDFTARRMGDGDYRDALEIIAISDDCCYYLVKMKEEQVSLCDRERANEMLPQLVIKFLEYALNLTEDED